MARRNPACILMNIRCRTLAMIAGLLGVLAPFAPSADKASQAKARVRGPRREEDMSKVAPSRTPVKIVVFKKTPQVDLKAHIFFPPGWSADDRRPAIVFWPGG